MSRRGQRLGGPFGHHSDFKLGWPLAFTGRRYFYLMALGCLANRDSRLRQAPIAVIHVSRSIGFWVQSRHFAT